MTLMREPASDGGRGCTRVSNVPASSNQNTSDCTSRIKVCVRVRPENATELEGNHCTVVNVIGDNLLMFDPKTEESPDYYHGKQRKMRDIRKKPKKDMRFVFDHVFDEHASNEELYEHTTKGILDGLLDGYNCSVFAYGATGAGKTFTMLGSESEPGVMFHTMRDLYQRISEIKPEKICEVAVSYLEVYNEQIHDLLTAGRGSLPIREDPQRGVVVAGLTLHKPRSAEELLNMLRYGNQNRTQHPTDANAESSRSHAVFQVFVRQRDRTANLSTDFRVAKLSLIDLAGSERATVTTNRGARFREGANINRSLLALGNCINALAEGKNKGHVPYRNSKLTRLLKDSLGGNCRTVMISAVSPSSLSYEDTYNTLKYANRAKNIKSSLKRNVMSVDFHLSQYTKVVSDLRQEVCELKLKLQQYEEGGATDTAASGQGAINKPELDRLRSLLASVFEERRNIRRELLELESSSRDIIYKIHRKECSLARLEAVVMETVEQDKLTAQLRRSIGAAKHRHGNIERRKVDVEERMKMNVCRLQQLESQLTALGDGNYMSQILASSLESHHLQVEKRDLKRQAKYLKKLCRTEQRQAQDTERLVLALLQTVSKQYFVLKGQGCVTSDLTAQFQHVQQLAGGERAVAWADQSVDASTLDSSCLAPPSSSEFDVSRLIEFPVLSCVGTTPRTPRTTVLAADRGSTPAWTPVTPRSRHSPAMLGCNTTTSVTATSSLASPYMAQGNSVLANTNNVVGSAVQSDTRHNVPYVTLTPSNDDTQRLNGTITLDDGVSILPMPGSDTTLHKPCVTGGIDTATVTKNRPVLTETKDKPHVVRSMDFSSVESPSLRDKLSYADAVKSPALQPTLNCRSPLTACENLPAFSSSTNITKNTSSRLSFFKGNMPKCQLFSGNKIKTAKNASSARRRSKSAVSQSTTVLLHKMGLPSAADRANSQPRSSSVRRPGYMQTTQAASYKKHKRRYLAVDGTWLSTVPGCRRYLAVDE
ncbi:Kinesin-like protein KIF18A [Lamellibrachia satsuma]|nr:Kinesin-like protein KIF18A [Lamellibrachia satsuma]